MAFPIVGMPFFVLSPHHPSKISRINVTILSVSNDITLTKESVMVANVLRARSKE